MFVIAIVNRKGGCGKSTLATHLATHFALQGQAVMLGDVDRQQSSRGWLRLREANLGARGGSITNWVADARNVLRPPPGVTHVVLDTPGALTGLELARVVMVADVILMPLCPSVFDRDASNQCLAELRTMPRVANGRCRVAAVGMRVEQRSRALSALQTWAAGQQVPLLGALRDSPAYVQCIERGLSLFDIRSPQMLSVDLPQWAPILDWLDVALRLSGKASEPGHDKPAERVRGDVTRPLATGAAPGPARASSRAPLAESPPPLRNLSALDRVLGILPSFKLRFTSKRS